MNLSKTISYLLLAGISLLIILMNMGSLMAQCDDSENEKMRPRVMVIPWVESTGGDPIKKYEEDPDIRNIIVSIQDEFLENDFPTKDFHNAYDQYKRDNAMEMVKLSGQDVISAILGGINDIDIIIRVEIQKATTPRGNSVALQFIAVNKQTSETMGTLPFGMANTRPFRDVTWIQLSQAAMHKEMDVERHGSEEKTTAILHFMLRLEDAFYRQAKEGITIEIRFGISEDAEIDFNSENDDMDTFSDLLEDWADENAFKGQYVLGAMSGGKFSIQIKKPFYNKDCQPMTVNRYERQIRKSMRKVLTDIDSSGEHTIPKADVVGSKIYFQITKKEL